ncbi:MAG: hypothetical protein PHZ02_10965 [Desulfocapsaceae bacterium]|nr:hypothetical protein [Desulfocapsaceae bacterium]
MSVIQTINKLLLIRSKRYAKYISAGITLCLLLIAQNVWAETPKVVVIPMSSTSAPVEKTLYLPGLAFRALNSFTAWQFSADGGVIQPTVDVSSEWIAPLPFAEGTKITAIELIWKNVIDRNGSSTITLRLTSEATAASLDVFNQTSTDASLGIHSVKRSINFVFSPPYHPIVAVSLSNKDRWLVGVKVSYME